MTPNQPVTIVTHDGLFHCDEALACWMLRQLFPDATVVRTRDPSKISQADYVVDVGGEYDHERKRYDHHQRGFEETYGGNPDVPLSSAGLVWRHYGPQLVRHIVRYDRTDLDDVAADTLAKEAYRSYIEHIDAIDNGVKQFDGRPRYVITTHISARVAEMNPTWLNAGDRDTADALFAQASEMVGAEFRDRVRRIHATWMPALERTQNALENATTTEHVLDLDGIWCPYDPHLRKLDGSGRIRFVVYQDPTSGTWRVRGVGNNRLPPEWWGLSDAIDGCLFVHRTGFVGGHQTQQGALKMAEMAVARGDGG